MRSSSFIFSSLVLCLALSFSDAVSVVSTTDAPLPVGLSKVLSELNVGDAEGSVAVATLLFSRSVTRRKRANCLQNLVGSTDSTSASDSNNANNKTYKAVGTDAGLVVAQPVTTDEVTASVTASGGNIVWIADAVDLARGEGLLDDMGPAMEALLNTNAAAAGAADTGSKAGTLIIVTDDIATGRAQLERAVQSILSTLVSPRPINSLEDIFEHVEYVTSPLEAVAVLKQQSQVSALAAKKRVAAAAANGVTTLSLATPLTPMDIAAARQLGPVALRVRRDAVQQVQAVCRDNNDGSPKLVVNFGALCDSAIQRALEELEEQHQATASSASLLSSAAGNQIRSSLRSDLDTDLFELFQEQMEQLKLASFEDFKKGLSKLLISPNLAADMEKVGNKAIAAFAASSKKMLPKKCAYWSIQPAKDQFRRSVKEYIQKRLLAARAGGQYKPLPRKGVTVGLHWLLPKPFGNDFRQEPWMVHATDNMVYVPKDKITDVSPDEVRARDWRTKIVPSPVGNEMVYMQ